ncbi:Stp1/IreP family PP2C-type Ser/Thr phosphatase [Extensimonas sp. H3M7-6]|uniref:Stp1/IreP family PP2C-type Ser/Thr phosphatase n=1 Tax=Extensimonas soli TaxID=3031322 RepID=UPI0023DAB467|nr:Stp1/IreP family PP2C-type Ser/Thr phosphatase [Extensimonas sp. H3M7-6]MDF1482813.1 Stp1/IreP family PP2C-type Ser/Thr phosphatase [Extensimonas sp. H3M7-6]
MRYDFATRTDRGRVRPNNEDAAAFDRATQLALLADGMGGYNAGEVASAMAIATVRADIAQWHAQAGPLASAEGARAALQASIGHANHRIWHAAHTQPACAGMGTTFVAALFVRQQLVLAHIGDSRCYRLRAGTLQQLTRDHSWLQEQIDAGLLTPAQAATLGMRNLITRALGSEPHAAADINEFTVAEHDLYLLCSDGLTDMVADAELAEILRAPMPLTEKTALLIDSANAHGGRDNISVLLVQAKVGARIGTKVAGAVRAKAGAAKRGILTRWRSA